MIVYTVDYTVAWLPEVSHTIHLFTLFTKISVHAQASTKFTPTKSAKTCSKETGWSGKTNNSQTEWHLQISTFPITYKD